MRFIFVFCSKKMKAIQAMKVTIKLFLLLMQIAFLLQDNSSVLFLRLGSLRGLFVFHNLNYFLKYKLDIFFFNIQNTKSNCRIIFLKRFSIIYF